MAKCYMTGIEVDIEDAYLLDRRVALSHLGELKSRIRVLENLIRNLGPEDTVKIRGKERRQRRLVSKVIADALGQSFSYDSLFVPWPRFKLDRTRWFLKSKGLASEFGESLAALDEAQLEQVAALGTAVLRKLDQPPRLPVHLRLPVLAGLCVAFPNWQADTISQMVRRLMTGESVDLQGIPESGQRGIQQIRAAFSDAPPPDETES
ncbi:MAG: hypothetical protein KDI88_02480 [Gammaproteobacteria bacterium]|nr:hypothetical protein [Gammaproteobacteria bacterium]